MISDVTFSLDTVINAYGFLAVARWGVALVIVAGVGGTIVLH